MNKLFKRIIKYWFQTLIVLVGMISCNLDEELVSTYGAHNSYLTLENAQEGVNGIYRYLNAATHPSAVYLNDMSADACYKSGLDYEIMNDNNLSGSVDVARAYNGNWQMIGCANSAIDNINLMDEEKFKHNKKQELLAEAHFMRAFAYYQLTNIFYRIPLITNGYYDAAANPVLATIDELDNQIEKDLLIAVNALPKTWKNEEGGRPTVGAAYGYLMRLHMRRAGRLREQGGNPEGAWRAALNFADNVIATDVYSLQPSVWDVFDPTTESSLYNNEIIFAVRSSDKVPSGSSDIALYFTPWYYNYGWDIFNIPLELYWKFESEDERLSRLIVSKYVNIYDSNKEYQAPPTINETGTINNEAGSPVIIELAQVYTNKYYYEMAGSYNYNTPNNFPLLRYADVLLCKAEILNELNGVNQQSVDLMNRIRERAFNSANHNYSIADFASADDFRNALCDERLFELNNEGVRRVDLIRMGLWKDRMDKYMMEIKAKVEKKEQNMGVPPGSLSAEWTIYPKFSDNPLKKYDKRRYYPIPKVYSSKFPDLLNNRDFAEE